MRGGLRNPQGDIMECLLNITNTLRESCSYVEMVPKRLKRQNFEGFKLIRLHSGQNKSGDLQKACCLSKGIWKAARGYTGVSFCSCQGLLTRFPDYTTQDPGYNSCRT